MGKPYTKWSQEEIEYVRLHARDMLYSDIAEVIGRTEEGVGARVALLGLNLNKNHCWSSEQETLLRELAPDHTVYELADVFGKTPNAVQQKIRRMKNPPVKYKHQSMTIYHWTPELTEELVELLETNSVREISYIIGVSEKKIRNKMRSLGISQKVYERKIRWTQEKTDQLIALAPDHSVRELSRILHIDNKTIAKKAKMMGLQPQEKYPWTEEEIQRLRQLAPTHSIYQLEKRIGKRAWVIEKKLKELNIQCIPTKKRIWTDEKLALLKEAAPTHTKNELVEILGIPRSTISLKIKELGLSFRKIK